MATPAPETLAEGRFRLLEVIGEGGMATVYRAFDLRLQRPRAIKVLSPSLASRPSLRKRFLSEAQTMANLEESRVVRIFDMGEDGDTVFIVMELVDGGSLVDRVRDYGPLPPRMAADATVQICESIQAAHDAGVIHRDIKPHNILLTRNGEIRITDFGIAQVQADDGMTKTGAVMGTWGFMAPEQKANAKQVDGRADVYSVGATLFSLLTGETPPELFMADSEPDMLAHIPEELQEVIRRATRYRREDRYLSARAMAESLRALIQLLPEDPEITVPLVPPMLEQRPRGLDTMQQFVSEMVNGPDRPHSVATMVPSVGELAEAPKAAAEAPKPAPRPVTIDPRAEGTQPAKPPPSGGGKWLLFGALGLGGIAVLGVIAVVVALPLLRPPEPTPKVPPETPPVATPITPPATPPVTAPTTPVDPPVVSTPTPEVKPPVATEPANGKTPKTPKTPTTTASPTPTTTPTAPTTTPTTTPAPTTAVVTNATPSEPVPSGATIQHTPPSGVAVGESLTFTAGLPGAGWTVKLYYRPASGGAFQEKTMVGSGSSYSTSVKASDTMGGGVAYFISATKGDTTLRAGSPTSPKKVTFNP